MSALHLEAEKPSRFHAFQMFRTVLVLEKLICLQFQRHAHGSVLLDKVFAHLELVERDFFGLQFLYVLGTKETQKRWLDPNKSIRKQMVCPPFHLCFRVKFYVSDPSKLVEEYTR
ncbi:FERM protein [Teladorsagia circumcincta]|uniref:FERM protein n=1 Tax=Teladorsagia circumcincta TaxID=45464 RepID=A0A2G9UBF8_TELCI|nr:FERM protein [Teladorsagia circumcincta]